MSFDYRIEALEVWPFERSRPRSHSFKASYSDTLALLDRELRHLGTRGTVIIQVVTDLGSIRRDGLLRSGAKVGYHGVALAFACKHGNLRYPCDTYERAGSMPSWQANLRAIALSLEALRAADRHGVAGKGQQYRGWLAIEASANGGEPLPFHDADSAYRWLAAVARTGAPSNASNRLAVVRIARREAHPDRNGGEREKWNQVEKAVELMRAAGMV